MISIREVFPAKDMVALGAITQMHLECFRPQEFHPEMLGKGCWWIAYKDGQPVAFAGMSNSNRWSDVIYLSRSGVVHEARGCGLQKRLIKVRVAKARRLGMHYCITDTRLNPASANSLIGCGFRMYQPQHPWSFKDACYWKKKLF